MPANFELKVIQKRQLFIYLKLKKELAGKGVSSETLNEQILLAEAEMDAEDVAWVEKKIAQL